MDIKLTQGNKKLGKDTFIMNITSATNCPSAKLGLCEVIKEKDGSINTWNCYAFRPEKFYPNCLPFREAQTRIFENTSGKDLANQIILKANSKRTNLINYLRFSESGDFRKQEDITRMGVISELIKEANISTYGYTARHDLSYDNKPKSLVINGQGFMVDNKINVVDSIQGLKNVCPGNCRSCDLCKVPGKREINILRH